MLAAGRGMGPAEDPAPALVRQDRLEGVPRPQRHPRPIVANEDPGDTASHTGTQIPMEAPGRRHGPDPGRPAPDLPLLPGLPRPFGAP